jgi:hypothetical protein
MEAGYRNLWRFLLLLPLAMAAGFWIPYFSEFPRFDPAITTAVHVHAALLFAWIALLVIQPLAIRRGAFRLHRLVGRASYLLMPLIVVFAAIMIRKEYFEHLASGMSPGAAWKSEYLSAIQLLILACTYLLAIVAILKRDAAAHMRYMICIALILLPAGLARTLGYWFDVRQSAAQTMCLIVIDLCLVGLLVTDWRRGVKSWPYLAFLLAHLAAGAGWLALGRPV